MPVPSVELALQGKAAGVFIESVTGKVTGATRVRIRGASSISASSEPLYVIDGIQINNQAQNEYGGDNNPLATFNFNDIESIEVLKDAAAAAIYGARGANGVIIITTKKGKAGESAFEFNYQKGWSAPSNKRDFMNAQEYIDYFRHAAYNADRYEERLDEAPAGSYDWWSGFVESRLGRYSGHAALYDDNGNYVGSAVNTNWQDEAFQSAQTQSADLSIRGGSEKLKYYSSVGYTNQEGIIVGRGFKRLSGRINLENNARAWLDFGSNFSLSITDLDQINADNDFANPIQLVALSPITPVRDPDGFLYDRPVTTYYNCLRHLEYSTKRMNEYRITNNSYFNLKFNENLSWKNEVGFDTYLLRENLKLGELTNDGSDGGYALSNFASTNTTVTKSILNFNKQFGDIGFSAIAGTEMAITRMNRTYVDATRFPSDNFTALDAASLTNTAQELPEDYSFLSYLSRFNFDYQEKYLFSLTGRIDGSSRFGKNNKYGFFPSASAGYVITKEDFLKDNAIISFLKPRISYGMVGNAEIGNYASMSLYEASEYNGYGGTVSLQLENPNLTWETTKSANFGIDFGFLDNRISGEFDIYSKITDDLLLERSVSGTSGYATYWDNVGSVENKGIEFLLNTNNLVGDFTWNTSFNIAYNKNKVANLAGQEIIDDGSSRFMNVLMVGQPIGVFYGAEFAGADPNNGDALWYVNGDSAYDANGIRRTTNEFSEANKVVLGHPNPDLNYSVTNTFGYKYSGWSFDLAFTFQGVAGNKLHLAGDSYMAASGEWFDNQLRSQRDSWTSTNTNTNIPEARLFYANGTQGRSSRYVEDGSYLKLRTLVFGVNLPKSLLNKYKLQDMRIFVTGRNLLTFTKYSGWDPEVSSDFAVNNIRSGIDFYSAPQPRTITIGVKLGF